MLVFLLAILGLRIQNSGEVEAGTVDGWGLSPVVGAILQEAESWRYDLRLLSQDPGLSPKVVLLYALFAWNVDHWLRWAEEMESRSGLARLCRKASTAI